MLHTADLSPNSATDRPPLVRPDNRENVAVSITKEFRVITLPPETHSAADAQRDSSATRATAELHRYGRFRSGWDGYRGRPFTDELIAAGIRVINLAIAVSRMQNTFIDAIIPGPASDGSIDIEFKRGDKTLIITMYPNTDEVEIYRESGGAGTYQGVPDQSLGMVTNLAWLAR